MRKEEIVELNDPPEFEIGDKVKSLRAQRVRSDLQDLRSYFSKH